MTDTVVDALIIDLLNWLAASERSYEEVLSAWRTSCPKLPVWEDARDRGFVAQENREGREVVKITPDGSAFLQQQKASRTIAPAAKA